MEPRVNVIVVARGLWEMTKKSLEGLIFTADLPWCLGFYSNGSEDETNEQFEEIASTWKWQYFCGYEFGKRVSPFSLAAAWNAMYKKMPPAEFTMFANNDVYYYQAGWMSRLVGLIEQGMDLAGIQEMTWYRFRFVQGSLMVARTETLEAMKQGGMLFDTRFKLSCEDVDLSYRFLHQGLRIGQATGLQPDYLVHIGHQSLTHYGSTEDLQGTMHKARRALCRKWGMEPQVED